jgi:RNA polymerase sigma factor (sigma-70 family)
MDATMGEAGPATSFDQLVDDHLVRVRRAAVARFGAEVGGEVAAEARAWAWANRDQVLGADNPAGLLFRVAQSRARTHHRWAARRAPVELLPDHDLHEATPELVDLFRALSRLSDPQRIAVVLVHAHGERYDDVAAVLGVSTAAVTNHVHRGLKKLRSMLED